MKNKFYTILITPQPVRAPSDSGAWKDTHGSEFQADGPLLHWYSVDNTHTL
jgi:hypothetical protein